MGLFGDKDMNRFKAELTAMRVAFTQMHRARSEEQFMAGVSSGANDITIIGRRLIAKGQEAEVRRLLEEPFPDGLSEYARGMFEMVVDMIREGFDSPESDFVR